MVNGMLLSSPSSHSRSEWPTVRNSDTGLAEDLPHLLDCTDLVEPILKFDYYNVSENDGNYSDDYQCSEEEGSLGSSFKILVPVVYLLIFLLGGLGNLLVLVILWRYRHSRTSTELFLFHLALANLLLLLTFPFGVVESLAGWIFGLFLCKVLSATNRISFYSSSLLLGCISVDRYLAVVYAVRTFRKQRVLSIHLTCLVVWVASLLLTLPDLLFTKVWPDNNNLSFCHFQVYGEHATNAWLATRFLYHVVGFFLPSVLMCYCYAAIVRALCQSQRLQQQKAVKVAILVTGVFLLCWSPYHIVIFWDTLLKMDASETGCLARDGLGTAITLCEMLGFSHCCLNPVLYAFVGVRFRHDACRILHDLGCLSQMSLQNILGTSWMESSSETNVSISRQPTSPRAVSLLAVSSSQDSTRQAAQGGCGEPESSQPRASGKWLWSSSWESGPSCERPGPNLRRASDCWA